MSNPQVETCPNCGAPLTLNERGRCVYCRAHPRTDGVSVPDVPSPAGAVLRTVGMLISEPAGHRVVEEQGLTEGVEALLDAVVVAGQRIGDAGLVLSDRSVDIKLYQPLEVWTFNLAADLIALLVLAPNLSKVKRLAAREILGRLDAGLGSHWCRSTIGNAGAGPVQLQQLRQDVPHRKPLRP